MTRANSHKKCAHLTKLRLTPQIDLTTGTTPKQQATSPSQQVVALEARSSLLMGDCLPSPVAARDQSRGPHGLAHRI